MNDPQSSLTAIARTLQSKLPSIVDEMSAHLADTIEGLDSDPTLRELLEPSVEGNISTYFLLLANDIGSESFQAPLAAVEYAVRVAQRDVPVSALIRAYQIGQGDLFQLTLDAVDELDVADADKTQLMRKAAERLHAYTDWITQHLAEVHETERRRWWSTRATLNAAIIQRVLRGEPVSASGFRAQTRYDVEQHHLALIVWFDDDDDTHQQRTVDGVVRKIARIVGSPHPPLVNAVDRNTLWAWIAQPGGVLPAGARDRIESLVSATPGVAVALGSPGQRGIEGFRQSHESARAARSVALHLPAETTPRVISETDPYVGLIAILLQDAKSARRWLRQVLGRFAEPGEAQRRIRETMNVFYAARENFSRTAEVLGIHRNTVKRRVDSFEAECLRARAHADTTELMLALRVYGVIIGE